MHSKYCSYYYYCSDYYYYYYYCINIVDNVNTRLSLSPYWYNGIITIVILLYEKFLQFDWLRAVVFQLNLKYLHVKITNL